MLAASRSRNKTEAILSLTTIAERWPKRLNDFNSRAIAHIVHEATNGEPSRFQLLNALFEANYAPEEFDRSLWWRDLALLQLQKGDPAAAQKAFGKVTAPYALVGVLSDNRFAPLRTEAAIDIPASIEREIREAREAIRVILTGCRRLCDSYRFRFRRCIMRRPCNSRMTRSRPWVDPKGPRLASSTARIASGCWIHVLGPFPGWKDGRSRGSACGCETST